MAIEKTVWEMTEAEIDALERKSIRMQIEGGDPEFVAAMRADIKKWREDREEARGQVIEWLKKRGDVAELEDASGLKLDTEMCVGSIPIIAKD